MVVGDFNFVLTREEVSNVGRFDKRINVGFQQWIDDHELIDMGFIGPCFTWTRGMSISSFKGPRLDRALCNMEWRILFKDIVVSHNSKMNSDHSLILIQLRSGVSRAKKPSFKFLAAWISHPWMNNLVRNTGAQMCLFKKTYQ